MNSFTDGSDQYQHSYIVVLDKNILIKQTRVFLRSAIGTLKMQGAQLMSNGEHSELRSAIIAIVQPIIKNIDSKNVRFPTCTGNGKA